MNIRIKNTQKKRRLATARIKAQIATLLRSSGLPDAELGVLFVGDRAMRTLNRRYRGKDATTDVLSFSLREGPFADVQSHLLGDIVVSVPRAERQAKDAGTPCADEIERLLVHGFAHLLGYDHEQGAVEEIRMQRKERQLLKRIAR